MSIVINPSSISIANNAAVVIRDDALLEKVRGTFNDRTRGSALPKPANLGCTNGGNCADETNLGSCVNSGTCVF